MTVNELIFDSLDNLNAFYIDLGTHTKQLTQELYISIQHYDINKYYLDIINNKPCMIIQLQDY